MGPDCRRFAGARRIANFIERHLVLGLDAWDERIVEGATMRAGQYPLVQFKLRGAAAAAAVTVEFIPMSKLLSTPAKTKELVRYHSQAATQTT